MLLSLAMLVAGLVLLVFAGDYLVKGAVGLAENFNIPPLIIGLTIVAFGTSAPELMVSLNSALTGVPDIAIGNIVGSNIANVLLVMGLPALIMAIPADQRGLSRNVAVMLVFTLVFMWMMNDGVITRIEGGILFAGLCIYIGEQILRARKIMGQGSDDAVHDYHDDIGEAPHSTGTIALYLIGGLIALPIAAHLTVSGASGIARIFGVSDAAIGLTVVAVGTSLPELAATLMAAWRKSGDVALGNIIGSNIFNIAAIIGITGLIIPVPVAASMISYDMWVMLGAGILLAVLCFAKITTGKVIGSAMLVAFAAYIVSVF
ncbi:MAG: calcium/sodium antiporter [Ahrensia sp.]|nr:calcium/sodium antiporter [Ahrensia sp.]